MTQIKNVFVSSTYGDLKAHREEVIKNIQIFDKLRAYGMEHMVNRGISAKEYSLEELEKCQLYVLIIGDCYGSIPDGEEKSYTHLEYLRAVDLYDQRKIDEIFVFIKDRSTKTLISEKEYKECSGDGRQEKLEEFEKSLKGKHTLRPFVDEDDLLKQIVKSLSVYLVSGRHKKEEDNSFNEESLKKITDKIDEESNEWVKNIEEFVGFVVESFEKVFKFEEDKLESQPFLRNIKSRLEHMIPGISLTPEDGVIKRAGVRHVIFRVQSILPILKLLEKKQLKEAGKMIGGSAAKNLVENTLKEYQMVPETAEAFVRLWDFWDSTGGWGKYILKSEESSIDQATDDGKYTWKLKVKNNFLTELGSEADVQKLSAFWEGYIFGFLDTSLPMISDIMTKIKVGGKKAPFTTVPAYIKVAEVEYYIPYDENEGVFLIFFKKDKFTKAKIKLIELRKLIEEEEWSKAVEQAYLALDFARRECRDDLFVNVLEGDDLSSSDRNTITFLLKSSLNIDGNTEEHAKNCAEAVDVFVKQLIQKCKDA